MNKLFDKVMIYTAYAYVTLPFLLFIIGWLRWYYAVVISLIVIGSLVLSLKQHIEFRQVDLKKHAKKIVIALFVISAIVFFSGIGGYGFQEEDFEFRNAVFNDLVSHHWPFMLNNPALDRPILYIYYIEYWLPAAFIGKLFGIAAGRFALYIWTVVSIALTFYFLCRMFKRFSLQLLFIFMFFGSLYIAGSFMHFPVKKVISGGAILWSGNMLLASANTVELYWIFNQVVTPWLIAALILNYMPRKNIMFLYALCYAQGPFFFIGLFPFVAIIILKDVVNSKEPFIKAITPYFSFQNTIGALAILLTGYFYLAGSSSVEPLFIKLRDIKEYIFVVFLVFGAISLLIFSKYKKEPFFYTIVLMLLILPLISMGTIQPFTFCARVSLAPIFMLMVLVARYHFEEQPSVTKKLVVIYLILGAAEPALTMARSVVFTTGYYTNPARMNKYLYNRAQLYYNPEPTDWAHENFLIRNKLKTLDTPVYQYSKYFNLQKDNTVFNTYLLKK